MRIRAIIGIIKKDIKEIYREKMVIFWVFIFPIMWMVLLGGIFGNSKDVEVDVGVFYKDELSKHLVDVMGNITYKNHKLFNVKVYNSTDNGLNALNNGKIDAFIVFQEDFGKNITSGRQGVVYIYYDETDPQKYQLVRGIVREFFIQVEEEIKNKSMEMQMQYIDKFMNNETLAKFTNFSNNLSVANIKEYITASNKPLIIQEKTINHKTSSIGFYVTSFIGIQFLFSAMLIVGLSVLDEIEKGTLRRVLASPITSWDFLIGKYLSSLAIIFVSIVVGLLFSKIVFGETIIPSIWGWFLIFIGCLFSMSLGLSIAMTTGSSKSTNTIIYLTSMPLLFLSGIVIPETILPSWAKIFVNYFPTGRILKDFRLLELNNIPVSNIYQDVIVLSLITLIIVVVSVMLYSKMVNEIYE
ncbi:ABC transporter permease [Methanotorris formicicus]|uniref:ABC-2 type transporter n=1 Tax=Methanotorris formicicus Mc-S-70 TaxID=647171 RepID=H1KZE2_9EURY|nr:ABC transporter permease [Methanotorris formicicus]EHP86062.1 ABC-2 type transporter [Methanotorris formicicus Mc-S-70]